MVDIWWRRKIGYRLPQIVLQVLKTDADHTANYVIVAHQFIRQAQVDRVSETTVTFVPIGLLSSFSIELTLFRRNQAIRSI